MAFIILRTRVCEWHFHIYRKKSAEFLPKTAHRRQLPDLIIAFKLGTRGWRS